MNKEICLVSYFTVAGGRANYLAQAQKHLLPSIENHWPHMYHLFCPDGGIRNHNSIVIENRNPEPKAFDFLSHYESPYAFKLAAIQEARELGYKKILWLDSIMQVVPGKSILELLYQSPQGFVAFDNLGHPLYKYISDKAAENLGIYDLNKLYEIQQCWGGAFMIDFDNPYAIEIFNDMVEESYTPGTFQDGESTRDGFVSHRHDQAALSVILYRHHVRLFPYGKILQRIHAEEPWEYGKDYYILYG